ncbi:ATP-binding protein [Alicyclobacillus dauci]|uniref:ATP-binding protein n=1 Tax=Alicyclobacillus dauci TaxID=1475485 RepID=UPI0038996CCC
MTVASYRDTVRDEGFVAAEEDLLNDAVLALSLSKNLLLRGPTGSGKTKLAQSLAEKFRLPMESINCSVDLDAESLLGFKTLTAENGQTVVSYVEGPVVRAMREGHLLYIDEINMARPETLPIINSVLDYRRQLMNPFTAETIVAHDKFRVIAAINEGYVGTLPMNEALKNRFVIVDVPYLTGEPLALLIQSRSRLQNRELIDLFVQLSGDLVRATKLGELSDEAASIRALLDACDFAAYIPPLRAAARAIASKLEDEREQQLVLNLAESYFAGWTAGA